MKGRSAEVHPQPRHWGHKYSDSGQTRNLCGHSKEDSKFSWEKGVWASEIAVASWNHLVLGMRPGHVPIPLAKHKTRQGQLVTLYMLSPVQFLVHQPCQN